MFVSEQELDGILGALRASKFIHAPISRGDEIYIKHRKLSEDNSVQNSDEERT